jgi:N-methylhydantoinase B
VKAIPVDIDARTVGMLRSGLSIVADAMGITVIRAAYSTTIKGGSDVSSALFDIAGRLVALSDVSMIGHLAPLRCAARSVLNDFPAGTMEPGDVFLMNDPYRGGVHANDMQLLNPVFVNGIPRYITATMVHVADVGGSSPGGLSGTVTDMFQEGLTLPPVRLHRRGVPVVDVYNILAANTRSPEMTLGDIRALVAGTKAGERELLALIARLGPDGADILESGIESLLALTEERTRRRIRELGSGSSRGEGFIDDDGVRMDTPLRVQVTVTVGDDHLVIDFTGTDPQAHGPISAPEGPAISAALYGVWILLADPDIPVNEGVFAPLEIIRPEGSLVAPRRPAAANARGFTMAAMIDAIVDAIAAMDPNRAMAGSAVNHVMTLALSDARGRASSFHDLDYGGAGARYGSGGVDAHGYAVFSGRAQIAAMELLELEHDVMFECHRLRSGSGGAGRWHGGRGIEKRLRVLNDATLTVRADKIRFPPRGAHGGSEGAPGGWIVNAGTTEERHLRSKETNVQLRNGDTITMLTSGGGGFGVPPSGEQGD